MELIQESEEAFLSVRSTVSSRVSCARKLTFLAASEYDSFCFRLSFPTRPFLQALL